MLLFNSNLFNGLLQKSGGQGTTDMIGSFLPFIVIIVIFYFLLFAPMRKQRKQVAKMIESLKNGDRVITTGGMYGVIAGVENDRFHLKIANNVKIEVVKSAIAAKIEDKKS